MTRIPTDAAKAYKKLIANAKAVKKCLEKSWMWENILDSVNYILENYTYETYLENKDLWKYCREKWISTIWGYGWIYKPFKIKSFRPQYLELIKKQYDEWIKDSYFTYWSYDYSISTDPENKKAWYSAEYKWCGNWHYYIMLDWDTALFMEDD